MAFDARQYLEALTPPTYVDSKGRTHTGRIVSFEEFVALQPMIEKIERREADPALWKAFVRQMCYVTFPPKHWWSRSPVIKDILRLPFHAQTEAIKDFCQSHSAALGLQTQKVQSGTTKKEMAATTMSLEPVSPTDTSSPAS